MYNLEKYFNSAFWFSSGLILDRVKYLIISILVFKLGPASVAIYYISIHLVNETSLFTNRMISSVFNRFFRDRVVTSDQQGLNRITNSSLQTALIAGLISSLIIYLLAFPISWIIKDTVYIKTIHILAFSVPLIIVTNQVMQILLLLTRYREAIIFSHFIQTIIVLAVNYIAIYFLSAKIYDLMFWQIASSGITFLIAVFLLHRAMPGFRLSIKFSKFLPNISPNSLKYALGLLVSNSADMLIVGYYFGTMKLGQYMATIFGPHLIYSIAIGSFGMFIHTALTWGADIVKITVLARKTLQFVLILAIPLTLLIILFPSEIINQIFRIHSQLDLTVVRILSLAFFVRLIGWMASQILIARRKQAISVKVSVAFSIIAVPLMFILAPIYGFSGVALTILAVSVLDSLSKTFILYRQEKVYFFSGDIIKMLGLGIIFYFFFRTWKNEHFIALLIALPALFLLGLIAIKSLKRSDWTLFTQGFYKSKLNQERFLEDNL